MRHLQVGLACRHLPRWLCEPAKTKQTTRDSVRLEGGGTATPGVVTCVFCSTNCFWQRKNKASLKKPYNLSFLNFKLNSNRPVSVWKSVGDNIRFHGQCCLIKSQYRDSLFVRFHKSWSYSWVPGPGWRWESDFLVGFLRRMSETHYQTLIPLCLKHYMCFLLN